MLFSKQAGLINVNLTELVQSELHPVYRNGFNRSVSQSTQFLQGLRQLGFSRIEARQLTDNLADYEWWEGAIDAATGGGYSAGKAAVTGDAKDLLTDPAGYLIKQNAEWIMQKILGPIMEKVLGRETGNAVTKIIQIVVSGGDNVKAYLEWTLSATWDMLAGIVKGGNVLWTVGVAFSKAILRAPGLDDMLEIIQTLRTNASLSTTKAKIKAELDQMAEKDPAFGFNLVLFLVSLIPWFTIPAKIAADPGGFAASVLSLTRTVNLELVRTQLGLSKSQIAIVDKVYGLVMLAFVNAKTANKFVNNFSNGMMAYGVSADQATDAANRLYKAVTSLSFADIGSSLAKMVQSISMAAKVAGKDPLDHQPGLQVNLQSQINSQKAELIYLQQSIKQLQKQNQELVVQLPTDKAQAIKLSVSKTTSLSGNAKTFLIITGALTSTALLSGGLLWYWRK